MSSLNDERRIARDHASRLISEHDPDALALLAEDAIEALPLLGIVVRTRPETAPAGGCSVDGSYSNAPPTVTVAESASYRRRNFTALHEYGHHLVRSDSEIHNLFGLLDDGGMRLEERLADAIAAEILLPDSVVSSIFGDRGPTAAQVVSLFNTTGASREACCVRAAQHLVAGGHVMLGERTIARFTATSGLPFRVSRGTDQGADSILVKAANLRAARQQASVRYRSGQLSGSFFADAVLDGDYVFAVFAERPAWVRFTVRNPDEVGPPEIDAMCRGCGEFTTRYPVYCPKCGEIRCPKPWCLDCWCEHAEPARRVCDECFQSRLLCRFVGASTTCLDCA